MKTKITTATILLTALMTTASISLQGQRRVDSLPALQDTVSFLVLKLTDGKIFYGKLQDNRNDTLFLLTGELGVIKIPHFAVKKVELRESLVIKSGRLWFPTPLPGRYFFAPSAFMLQPGEGYYQNTMVVLNSFNVGVTRWLSLGGGIEFLSTFISLTQSDFRPTFFVTPKVGLTLAKNFRAGAGVLYAQIAGNEYRISTFYSVFTVGDEDANFSTGFGWGSFTEEGEKASFQSKPMITLCGTVRAGRRLAFVTENWLFPSDRDSGPFYTGLFSYGMRFMGENISVDMAFINNKEIFSTIFIGIPFVSFTVKF